MVESLGAEVHARRLPSELVCRDCGQQVLGGVLLHMVPAARCVDFAVHRPRGKLPIQDVHNVDSLLDHIEHTRSSEHAGIVRLASGRRVERRAIEDDTVRISHVRNHGCIERQLHRVAIVDALRHPTHTPSPSRICPVPLGTRF